jgi:6,7-dimethyl-8-ribityllumazine synthase
MTPQNKSKEITLPGARLLLVVGAYHASVVDQLVKGAEAAILKAGAKVDRVDVPGAFELPAAIVYASCSHGYDGYVALGCVVKGETDHYDYICTETARGIMELSRDGFCVGFGVLTVHTLGQAEERADVARGDKGGEAARACLSMIAIKRKYKGALG